MLAVAAGLLLLLLLLEGAGRRVPQAKAHAVLLGRRRPLAARGHEDGGGVLEGCAGHGAGHAGVVGQARVAVARRQEGLLAAVVLALGLALGLGGLALALVLALGGLGGRQAGGGGWGGGVTTAKLGDFT